jgi:WD40 repeat protein
LFPAEIESDYEASLLDWHPTEKIVAVGWSDGTNLFEFFSFFFIYDLIGSIMTISVDLKQRPSIIYSSSSYHSASLSILKWNPSGKRLVTGDKVISFVLLSLCFIICH